MKKIWQKFLLTFLYVLGIGLTYGMTLYAIIKNLVIGQSNKVIYSMSSAMILFVLFIIISRWVIRIYDRKLQAIAVAEELSVVPATNFIIIRILKQLEILLPIGIVGLMLYGISHIQVPTYIVFRDIIFWVVLGLVFFLAHDGFKVYFMNINLVEDQVRLDNKKEEYRKKKYKTEIKRKRKK